jgi:hypothetical protein
VGLLNLRPERVSSLLAGELPINPSPRAQSTLLGQTLVPLPRPLPIPLPPILIPPWLNRKGNDDDPPIVPPSGPPRRKSEEDCEWEHEKNRERCEAAFGGPYSRMWRQRAACNEAAFKVYAACRAGKPEPPFDPEWFAYNPDKP